ncbi:MAG TPA: class I SAM-dependent methyltransferase [Saprospiraceae bacterium]|nr:class I SAM-dependent methyltransferase [Saprospiraceae bacterium]
MKNAYIAVSREQGELMYRTILDNGYRHIVEYGTSFGISTIYLAAAARETGGKVVTTELLPEKAEKAHQSFVEAGLDNLIEIKIGDVMQTLKGYTDPIDLLFLDGWKEQYLPLTQMLEPNFREKTLLVADNLGMEGVKQYLKYIRNSPKYRSETIGTDKGGTEFTYFIKN